MKNYRLNVTTQSLIRENNFLFNYQDKNIISYHQKILYPCLIYKSIDNTIYFLQKKDKNFQYTQLNKKDNIIGIIIKNENNEFIWTYNQFFENGVFLIPFENMNWIVLKNTIFSNQKKSHLLKEGDIIKLGNIVLLTRKIQMISSLIEKTISVNKNTLEINNNKNTNEYKNEIYKNKIFNTIENIKNEKITSKKLNSIYIQIKKKKTKEKNYICRICLLEGDFIGENPLINLCQCLGSVKYLHLNCAKKWFSSKTYNYISQDKSIICYSFSTFICELCKSEISEKIKINNESISLLDIDPEILKNSYLSFETIHHYNQSELSNNNYHLVYYISLNKINNNKITIGRCSSSDIIINDISVSRNHCNLTLENDKIYVDDCSSKFGTLLMIQNDFTFIPWKEINLQLGKYLLKFYLTTNILCCLKFKNNFNNNNITYDSQFNFQRQNVYEEILNDIIDVSKKKNYDDDNDTSSRNNDNKSIVSSTIKMLDYSNRDKNEIQKYNLHQNLSNSKSDLEVENSSKENFFFKKKDQLLLHKTEIGSKNNFELSKIKKNNSIQKNFTFNIIKKK